MGNQAVASGWSATALGQLTKAEAFGSLAIGRLNVGGFTLIDDGNPWTDGDFNWIDSDPVFEIGNGYWVGNVAHRRNAFTVFKNGDAEFLGKVRVARGGDIKMFGEP
jgi:hypothetical protein